MSALRCECGFMAGDAELIIDHFLEIFAPADDKASDGEVHVEWICNLTCKYGCPAGCARELDQHFLQVFRSDDNIGRDRNAHAVAGAGGPEWPRA
jgi:hypothetical protein